MMTFITRFFSIMFGKVVSSMDHVIVSERNTVGNHCEGNSFIETVPLILCLVLSSRVSGIKKLPVKYPFA